MADICKHNWQYIDMRLEAIANTTTSTMLQTVQYAYFTCNRCRKTEKRLVENATQSRKDNND